MSGGFPAAGGLALLHPASSEEHPDLTRMRIIHVVGVRQDAELCTQGAMATRRIEIFDPGTGIKYHDLFFSSDLALRKSGSKAAKQAAPSGANKKTFG